MFIGTDASIASLRGRVHRFRGIPLVVTYHPAYLLRNLPDKAKAEAVRALAEREGLELIRCTAYSDSANDVPMLSLVGRAVAVNPDAALRSHARAVGWEIHDYRRARFATHYYIPAGLAAAAGLAGRSGLTVTLCESRPRWGGRASSFLDQTTGGNGFWVFKDASRASGHGLTRTAFRY